VAGPRSSNDDMLKTQRITTPQDLADVRFENGVATVDVHVDHLDLLPLKNAERFDDDRLRTLVRRIRRYGYTSFDPVVAQVGRKGSWIVINGGHRLTAARKVAGEFWANLLHRKVGLIHFLVYRTPVSDIAVDEYALPDVVPAAEKEKAEKRRAKKKKKKKMDKKAAKKAAKQADA
jgi:hypothetical protein